MMWNSEKKSVMETAQQMAQTGLVIGSMGNVSTRLSDPDGRELIAITPSGCCYETLDLADIIIVDFEGKTVEGKLAPSIETMLHIGIYKARSKVKAIVHAHSVYGSILSVAHLEIPAILDDQVICLGGEIRVAEYALPGSGELVQNVVNALGLRNSVILANHGTLSVGRDLKEAFTNCEMCEKVAKVFTNALSIGKVTPLSAEALEKERAIFNLHHCGE
ncbi:class II aldolase/adducin family protein [Chloroflexota bacterium]